MMSGTRCKKGWEAALPARLRLERDMLKPKQQDLHNNATNTHKSTNYKDKREKKQRRSETALGGKTHGKRLDGTLSH